MSFLDPVVITGIGIEVPGLTNRESLLTRQEALSPGEFDPISKLGRRGLRYKNKATQLALCAAHDALLDAGLSPAQPDDPATTGVVVSSNLGNIDTVCRMVQTVRQGSVEDLSPMDVPNASSNVIATSVAIRFHCRALNLMLCNGATSGLDALYVAANAIKARRARRLLVVGVEPHNDFAHKLMAASGEMKGRPSPAKALVDGAACLILEAASLASARGGRIYGTLSGYHYAAPTDDPALSIRQALEQAAACPGLWLTPDLGWPEVRAMIADLLSTESNGRLSTLDLSRVLGELYGALGIFQGAVACLWLQQQSGSNHTVLATAGKTWGDGMASLMFHKIKMGSGIRDQLRTPRSLIPDPRSLFSGETT